MELSHAVAATAERRRSERREYVVEAYISSPTATSDTDRCEVTSVNLSRHGIAFDHDQPLPKRTYYRLQIRVGGMPADTEICIVSCRPIENGMYQIGAEFC